MIRFMGMYFGLKLRFKIHACSRNKNRFVWKGRQLLKTKGDKLPYRLFIGHEIIIHSYRIAFTGLAVAALSV